MAIDNINDGVGKKIVEALKMQGAEHPDNEVFVNEDVIDEGSSDSLVYSDTDYSQSEQSSFIVESEPIYVNQELQTPSYVDNVFQQTMAQNLGATAYASLQDDYDYPPNVAVLKQLIAKLPSGVSKQTGAVIIKQTMEALGISMNSVLQEAKQVQDDLMNNSKECQNNIVEYRKQISIMEAKAQQYQRQSSMMNDIISLFVQTTIH